MSTKRQILSKIVALFFSAAASVYSSNPNNTLVGAIRWDAWVGADASAGLEVEASLSPDHWHYRLPFYAKIVGPNSIEARGNDPVIVDQEIAYAKAAGINYFAYVLYRNTGSLAALGDSLAYHLSSPNKTDVNACAIVECYQVSSSTVWYNEYKPRLLSYFQDAAYQKVLGGRPLIYLFTANRLATVFGSWALANAALADLASASIAQGSGDPYFVVMEFNSGTASGSKTNLGADAVSCYATTSVGSPAGSAFTSMNSTEATAWNTYKTAGGKVVPWVTMGWDKRTRYENPVSWESPPPSNFLSYVENPTSGEVATHLQTAINWVGSNSSAADANTVLIYAWNEFDEGGWICPTYERGPSRLNAIAGVLGAPGITNGSASIQDWGFSSSDEGWTAAAGISGFAPNATAPGTIEGSVTGSDPQLLSPDNLGLTLDFHRFVTVRLKNATTASTGQVYYTTVADPTWDTFKMKSFSLVPSDTNQREYTINLSPEPLWSGSLKQLRLDPEDGASSGNFAVDFVRVTDHAPNTPYETCSPVAAYLLDQSTGATRAPDGASAGHVGYVTGGATWVAGVRGNALQFNGSNAYLDVHDSMLLKGMPQLTIAGWVYLSALPTQNCVPFAKESAYRIVISSAGIVNVAVATTSNAWYTTGTTLSFGSALTTGQWYHLAATYDGTRLRTYLNGSLVNTAASTISGSIISNTTNFRCGYKTATNIDWMNGRVDEVFVARRALSASEILFLYQTPTQ